MQSRRKAEPILKEDLFKKEVNDAIASLRTYIDMTNEAVNNLQERQVSNKESHNIILSQLQSYVHDMESKLFAFLDEHKKQVAKSLDEHLSALKTIDATKVTNQAFHNVIPDIQEKIESTAHELIRFKGEMHALAQDFYDSMLKNFDKFKQEIILKPTGIEDVKKYLEQKLEVVAMDGSNAILRSANCEKHVNLLEKKIECIMLLIKKMDLNKQES